MQQLVHIILYCMLEIIYSRKMLIQTYLLVEGYIWAFIYEVTSF